MSAKEELWTAPESPVVEDSKPAEASTGERFDPFCHTLDAQGRALCFADVTGRRVHSRVFPTASSIFTAVTCQVCGRVTCPTCTEIEARMGRQ